MRTHQIDIARSSILLSNCPEEVVAQLLGRARVRQVGRGQTIFEHGDDAHSVFVVLDGWVKLYRTSSSGSEAIVGVFTRGHSFGEAVALRNSRYPVTAEAATNCELMQIPAPDILDSMLAHPEVCIAILSSTFEHLHGLVKEVEQLKAKSGAQRVARFLLSLCACEEGQCTVILPFDKGLIAGRIGMQPESLSRSFGRLKAQGVEVAHNHAKIADVETLRAFVEDDGFEEGRGQGRAS